MCDRLDYILTIWIKYDILEYILIYAYLKKTQRNPTTTKNNLIK